MLIGRGLDLGRGVGVGVEFVEVRGVGAGDRVAASLRSLLTAAAALPSPRALSLRPLVVLTRRLSPSFVSRSAVGAGCARGVGLAIGREAVAGGVGPALETLRRCSAPAGLFRFFTSPPQPSLSRWLNTALRARNWRPQPA